MKKCLAFLLALVMLLSSAVALAADFEDVVGTWDLVSVKSKKYSQADVESLFGDSDGKVWFVFSYDNDGSRFGSYDGSSLWGAWYMKGNYICEPLSSTPGGTYDPKNDTIKYNVQGQIEMTLKRRTVMDDAVYGNAIKGDAKANVNWKNRTLSVKVNVPGANAGDVQATCDNLPLESGKTYKLSFLVKSGRPDTFHVSVSGGQDVLCSSDVATTNKEARFTTTFTASSTSEAELCLSFGTAVKGNNFSLTRILVEEVYKK